MKVVNLFFLLATVSMASMLAHADLITRHDGYTEIQKVNAGQGDDRIDISYYLDNRKAPIPEITFTIKSTMVYAENKSKSDRDIKTTITTSNEEIKKSFEEANLDYPHFHSKLIIQNSDGTYQLEVTFYRSNADHALPVIQKFFKIREGSEEGKDVKEVSVLPITIENQIPRIFYGISHEELVKEIAAIVESHEFVKDRDWYVTFDDNRKPTKMYNTYPLRSKLGKVMALAPLDFDVNLNTAQILETGCPHPGEKGYEDCMNIAEAIYRDITHAYDSSEESKKRAHVWLADRTLSKLIGKKEKLPPKEEQADLNAERLLVELAHTTKAFSDAADLAAKTTHSQEDQGTGREMITEIAQYLTKLLESHGKSPATIISDQDEPYTEQVPSVLPVTLNPVETREDEIQLDSERREILVSFFTHALEAGELYPAEILKQRASRIAYCMEDDLHTSPKDLPFEVGYGDRTFVELFKLVVQKSEKNYTLKSQLSGIEGCLREQPKQPLKAEIRRGIPYETSFDGHGFVGLLEKMGAFSQENRTLKNQLKELGAYANSISSVPNVNGTQTSTAVQDASFLDVGKGKEREDRNGNSAF